MLNPYIASNIRSGNKKRVTVEITDEYAEQLWEKRKIIFKAKYDPDCLNMNTEEHYRSFKIPKKSNPKKMRQIDAPDDALSNIQVRFKEQIEEEIQALPHKAAHAYVKACSTVTAMQVHQANNSKWFLQIDLKDFFNSITGDWLNKQLDLVFPFKFVDKTWKGAMIHTSLLRGALPQGSHLSPLLTNLVMVPIDYVLTETLHNYNKHHYVYTRYADDITISCKEKFNPEEILSIIYKVFKEFKVPFRINEEKTRFGSNAGRNYHLGLIINKDNQISVGHEKNQKFRAMIFNFCTVGEEWELHDIQKMLGLISYYKAIEPEFVKKVLTKYGGKYGIDIEAKAKALIAI